MKFKIQIDVAQRMNVAAVAIQPLVTRHAAVLPFHHGGYSKFNFLKCLFYKLRLLDFIFLKRTSYSFLCMCCWLHSNRCIDMLLCKEK